MDRSQSDPDVAGGPVAFSTSTTADGDQVVLRVTGEIDLVHAAALEAALTDAVEQSADVVIDMAEVAFMDSTGLNALIQSANRAAERQGSIRVRGLRPNVRRLYDLSGLADVIPVVD